jgi:hypothetical protein
MPGPWEDYAPQQASAQAEDGPWADYANEADMQDDGGLEIDIVGGTPVQSERNPANDSDFARMISGQPRHAQQGNAVGRFLGEVGGRQVLQGAAGLLGSLGGDALDRYVISPLDDAIGTTGTPYQLGYHGRSFRQVASDYADSVGMRKQSEYSPSERVASDISEALTGTALTLGAGSAAAAAPGAISRVGQFFSANPITQVVGTVTGTGAASATREVGGSQGQQLAAGLIGGLSPAVVTSGGSAALRGAIRGGEAGRQTVQENIRRFDQVGARPSVGQATGSRVARGIESTLARTPGATSVINERAARQSDDIARGVEDIASRLSPSSSAGRAGQAVVDGISGPGGYIERGKDIASRLYDRVDQYIPQNQQVGVNNTQKTLNQLVRPNPNAPQTSGLLANSRLSQIDKALTNDLALAQAKGSSGLPYEVVKDLRSRVGRLLVGNELISDIPKAELKRVYGALSQDLDEAARIAGPQAERATKQANNFYKALSARAEQLETVINKNGGPEKVFRAIESTTRDGDTTIRTVMNSLPREGQKELAAAFVRRLGRSVSSQQNDSGSQFSAQTFLTNWDKISPEAKRALFNRFGPGFTDDMNAVAKVASNLREGSQVFANPSGTAAAGAQIASLASFVTALGTGNLGVAGTIAGGATLSNALARAYTNPRFVSWLARQTKAPVGAIPAQAQVLSRLGDKYDEPELQEVAYALNQAYQAEAPQAGNQERTR